MSITKFVCRHAYYKVCAQQRNSYQKVLTVSGVILVICCFNTHCLVSFPFFGKNIFFFRWKAVIIIGLLFFLFLFRQINQRKFILMWRESLSLDLDWKSLFVILFDFFFAIDVCWNNWNRKAFENRIGLPRPLFLE